MIIQSVTRDAGRVARVCSLRKDSGSVTAWSAQRRDAGEARQDSVTGVTGRRFRDACVLFRGRTDGPTDGRTDGRAAVGEGRLGKQKRARVGEQWLGAAACCLCVYCDGFLLILNFHSPNGVDRIQEQHFPLLKVFQWNY